MMKKEYIQPEMEVVKIHVGTLLAGSANTLFDDVADGTESLAPEMPNIPGMKFMTPESMLGIPE